MKKSIGLSNRVLNRIPNCFEAELSNADFTPKIDYFLQVDRSHSFKPNAIDLLDFDIVEIDTPMSKVEIQGDTLRLISAQQDRLRSIKLVALSKREECRVLIELYAGFFDSKVMKNPGLQGSYELTWVGDEERCGFELPYGSDVGKIDGVDILAISDCVNHHVCLFDLNGKYLRKIFPNGQGKGPGFLSTPADIKINSKNNKIFIVEETNHRIQWSDASGNSFGTFGEFGDGAKQFNNPLGITIDDDDNIWISDFRNNAIKKYSENFDVIMGLSGRGCKKGQLNGPYYLEDLNNDIYINDRTNNRIQVYNPEKVLLQ